MRPAKNGPDKRGIAPLSTGCRLDRIDLRILSTLQDDGRITKLHLAEIVRLSVSACFERMRRLERAGLIRGYHADIAVARIVPITEALVEVTLGRHEAGDFSRFERAIQGTDEVIDCFSIGGGIDYMLRVVARDIAHYQSLIDGLLEADLGISRYFTYFVTREVKRAKSYPLSSLIRGDTG